MTTERGPSFSQGNGLARLADFVFLLRPTALVPAWLFVARGARMAAPDQPPFALLPDRGTALALLAMTFVLGGGYILNQMTDIETDRRNDKLFLLPRGIITLRAAAALMAAVWGAAVLVALPLPSGTRWALVIGLGLALTYSAAPIRAKAVPGLDLVWNGLGFGAASFAAGWFAGGGGPGLPVAAVVSYVLAVAGLIASTTIPDIDGDRAEGLRTTGVALGERRTSVLAVTLLLVAAVLSLVARDVAGCAAATVGVALLVRAHVVGSRQARVFADQWTVAAYALAFGFRDPYLLVLLAAVFVASRVYYRHRFGLQYPGRGTP